MLTGHKSTVNKVLCTFTTLNMFRESTETEIVKETFT